MDILNLGCGNKPIVGAINHDRIIHRPDIDIAWDLNDLPWPWADNSFDLIVALAVLEHLRINLIESVNECWRILRPGGELYIKLPYWDSEVSYIDPTHYWRFSPSSLDIFDPSTEYGRRYSFYTPYKWTIIKAPQLNRAGTSFHARMRVIK